MAKLQTFPQDIAFIGNRASIQRQIGNAVPSLMGEVLAREIAKQFFEAKTWDKLSLALEPRRPIPPPEPVEPVPEKYLGLIGDHPDHPGEGKGKRAILRQGAP
jgi:DNA (cytosine-5)-methyltransferase 1